MVIVNKFDALGLPPQMRNTINGLNTILSDLGFPRWTLVRWPVPPMMTLFLFITLLVSGLRWFAIFEIAFILYKFFEEYGDPMSDWMHTGAMRGYITSNSGSRSTSRPRTDTTSSSRTRSESGRRQTPSSRSSPQAKRKVTTFEDNDDDSDS